MTVCFSHKIRKIEHLSATMAEMSGQGQDQGTGGICANNFLDTYLFQLFDIYHLKDISFIYIK